MLPYEEDRKKLEKLLEKLFEEDNDYESMPKDIKVLGNPRPFEPFTSCWGSPETKSSLPYCR